MPITKKNLEGIEYYHSELSKWLERTRHLFYIRDCVPIEEAYEIAGEYDLPKTQEELQTFINFIEEENFINKYSEINSSIGIYLSRAINELKEEEVYLRTREPFNYFCSYLQNKKINIEGNLGNFFAHNLKGGFAEVNGNIGLFGGNNMQKGKVYIYGDAGHFLGGGMVGGEIHCFGNIGECPGYKRKGGKIYVCGIEIKDLSQLYQKRINSNKNI